MAAFLPEVLGLGVRWALQVLCPQPAGGEDSGEVTVTSTRFHWQECTPGQAATRLTRATSGARLAVGNCVHLRRSHSTSTPTSSEKLVTEAPVCVLPCTERPTGQFSGDLLGLMGFLSRAEEHH